jgi:hypothetical protein
MTPDEQQRMNSLCQQITTEQDSKRFDQLVEALNDLLDGKANRLDDYSSKPPKTEPN